MSTQNILEPGRGYSTDTKQIAPQRCLNIASIITGDQYSFVKLDSAMSYSQFMNSVSKDKGGGLSLKIFKVKGHNNPTDTKVDNDFEIKFIYVNGVQSTISVNLGGEGEDILTDVGKAFYKKNPHFGLICGDSYISSYDQGAMLVLELTLRFKTHSEKKEKGKGFEVGIGLGDILSASKKTTEIANATNTEGYMSIHVFQVGGDPTQLPKVFREDGASYPLTCQMGSAESCLKAASAALNYATNDFPEQIRNQTNLIALPNYVKQPIKQFIKDYKAPCFATNEVLQIRNDQKNTENAYNYYEDYMQSLLSYYPVNWNFKSGLYNNISQMQDNIRKNLNLLSDPDFGIAICYDTPLECVETNRNLNRNMIPVDMSIIQDIKYIYELPHKNGNSPLGHFYKNSDGESGWSYSGTLPTSTYYESQLSLSSVVIRSTSFDSVFSASLSSSLGEKNVKIINNCSLNDINTYKCTTQEIIEISTSEGKLSNSSNMDTIAIRDNSPFYFDLYKNETAYLEENNPCINKSVLYSIMKNYDTVDELAVPVFKYTNQPSTQANSTIEPKTTNETVQNSTYPTEISRDKTLMIPTPVDFSISDDLSSNSEHSSLTMGLSIGFAVAGVVAITATIAALYIYYKNSFGGVLAIATPNVVQNAVTDLAGSAASAEAKVLELQDAESMTSPLSGATGATTPLELGSSA